MVDPLRRAAVEHRIQPERTADFRAGPLGSARTVGCAAAPRAEREPLQQPLQRGEVRRTLSGRVVPSQRGCCSGPRVDSFYTVLQFMPKCEPAMLFEGMAGVHSLL